MTAPDLCPARRHDRPEEGERVVCIHEPHIPGALGFACWRCLEHMLERAKNREAIAQEWED